MTDFHKSETPLETGIAPCICSGLPQSSYDTLAAENKRLRETNERLLRKLGEVEVCEDECATIRTHARQLAAMYDLGKEKEREKIVAYLHERETVVPASTWAAMIEEGKHND